MDARNEPPPWGFGGRCAKFTPQDLAALVGTAQFTPKELAAFIAAARFSIDDLVAIVEAAAVAAERLRTGNLTAPTPEASVPQVKRKRAPQLSTRAIARWRL